MSGRDFQLDTTGILITKLMTRCRDRTNHLLVNPLLSNPNIVPKFNLKSDINTVPTKMKWKYQHTVMFLDFSENA